METQIAFPVGIFLYGWTTSEYVDSWVPSVIGLGFVGAGVVLIFVRVAPFRVHLGCSGLFSYKL